MTRFLCCALLAVVAALPPLQFESIGFKLPSLLGYLDEQLQAVEPKGRLGAGIHAPDFGLPSPSGEGCGEAKEGRVVDVLRCV